jgi:hypothetical protein
VYVAVQATGIMLWSRETHGKDTLRKYLLLRVPTHTLAAQSLVRDEIFWTEYVCFLTYRSYHKSFCMAETNQWSKSNPN